MTTRATRSFAVHKAGAALGPFTIERREPRADDVEIDIQFCGVCHSDIHQARDEWGGAIFPMVPGHEIVGTVTRVGAAVTRFRVGERVGVGCMVDSCGTCGACAADLQQHCEDHWVGTYNAYERDGVTPTYGGYSERIVVNEAFVLRMPTNLDPAAAAPLLCAGITTYSPLRRWQAGPGRRVGVAGLGGLGHMGIKLAHALGAETTAFTTTERKRGEAKRLGADEVVLSSDAGAMKAQAGRFDLIIDTISAPHDINALAQLLRRDGTLCLVGVPPEATRLAAGVLVMGRRQIAGSLIGGVGETQEMLDLCGERGVVSDVEVIPIQEINVAYDRAVASDVKYRFVIDIASLRR